MSYFIAKFQADGNDLRHVMPGLRFVAGIGLMYPCFSEGPNDRIHRQRLREFVEELNTRPTDESADIYRPNEEGTEP